MDKYNIPRVFFINKIEKEHVKANEVVSQLQERFGIKCVPVQIPIGEGPEYKGLVDLVKMKAITFDEKGQPAEGDIPGDLQGAADDARQKLIEAVAEADDSLLEKFFEEGELSDDEVKNGLKTAITKQTIFPIMFGSADLNSGVHSLLNFAEDYFPSPFDIGPNNFLKAGSDELVSVETDPSGQPLAYVFISLYEAQVGEIDLFKVYSGKVNQALDL